MLLVQNDKSDIIHIVDSARYFGGTMVPVIGPLHNTPKLRLYCTVRKGEIEEVNCPICRETFLKSAIEQTKGAPEQ